MHSFSQFTPFVKVSSNNGVFENRNNCVTAKLINKAFERRKFVKLFFSIVAQTLRVVY